VSVRTRPDDGRRPGGDLSGVHRRARQAVHLLDRYPAGARVLGVARAIRRRWRRSLQLRVVTTTMLLGSVVIVALGFFLFESISGGLVRAREVSAFAEASRLTESARDLIVGHQISNADSVAQAIQDTVYRVQGPVDEQERAVVMVRAESSSVPEIYPGASTGGVGVEDLPTDLRDRVNAGSKQQGERFPLPAGSLDDGRTVPAFAVGSLIDVPLAGKYELYFIYPLQREQEILALVERTMIAGGLAIVLLISGVALLVTRQVVAPVRQAAHTAEELASGRLDRRMQVHGDDELARLGRAFNEMAAGLERQIHRLEELSRVQRRFVSDVSHELRTPLTTIRMASEVINESRESFDPATSRSAELLQAQLDRFEALLGDLLEISRFDAGAAVLEVERTDLGEVVTRAVDGLEPIAERRGSVVRIESSTQDCLAEIDPRRVERIVRNLVANAIEHGEGRPVEVTLAANDDAVAVGVRDHGVGLRPGETTMVFNRFWRADPARARTTGGTGLGLAIALEDAHLHGGWLQVWGEPGVGAYFRLTLPREAGVVLQASPLPPVPYPDYVRDGENGGRGPTEVVAAIPVLAPVDGRDG
jgi:two-component system sensor histidine kinase MtrB